MMRRAAVQPGRSRSAPGRPTVDPVIRAAEHAIECAKLTGRPLTREYVATLVRDMRTLRMIKKEPPVGRVWHYLRQTAPQWTADRPPDRPGQSRLPGEAPTPVPADLDVL